jgi:acetyl esterase/lipase
MASPEHEAIVEHMRAHGRSTPETLPPLEHRRAALDAMNANFVPDPPEVASEPGIVGGVPGWWFRPAGADPARVIVYFHGGGYMFGSARNTGHVTARLARAAGCHAFGVDYRLSWQAPFPAAVDDAVAVSRALLADGRDLGTVALAGDSAGGGLAIAALVALRDAGDPLPAAAFASSAYTDLTVSGESAVAIDDPVCNREGLLMLGTAYLDGADPREPLASPLFADLTGLPPLLLQVGGQEALLDDTTRIAERARAAGVDVTLEVLDGVIHIWQYFGPDLPETRESEARAGAFLRAHMA